MTSRAECRCCCCQPSPYYPIRSVWVRNMLSNGESVQSTDHVDRRAWYRLKRTDLIRPEFLELFEEFHEDEETTAFIVQSQQKSDNISIQIFHSIASTVLSVFMARTSANGLLNRGRMFVYSTAQFKKLLDIDESQSTRFESLLDIGAGDGSVTQRMASLFDNVYATELSFIMQRRLSTNGYKVLDINNWGNLKFNVITCLNVLDRCEKPLTLLKNIRDHAVPNSSQVIIGLVFPFKPYVEYNNDHRPGESITLKSRLAEEQINEFVSSVFQPLGFRLKKFTRLPYLCEGDLERNYYFLLDYIFVFEII